MRQQVHVALNSLEENNVSSDIGLGVQLVATPAAQLAY